MELSESLTLAAVIVALVGPYLFSYVARRIKARHIRMIALLYLRSFQSKIEDVIEKLDNENYPGNAFEKENQKNFDSLEFIFQTADVLVRKRICALLEFILFYKSASSISNTTDEGGELAHEYKRRIDLLLTLFKTGKKKKAKTHKKIGRGSSSKGE